MALDIAEGDIQLTTQPRILGVSKDILEFSMAGHSRKNIVPAVAVGIS